jgi:hypothetical protein
MEVNGFCFWRLKVCDLYFMACLFALLSLNLPKFKLCIQGKVFPKIKWWFCLKNIVLNKRTCTCDVV